MKKPKTMFQISLAVVDELLEHHFFPKLIQPFLKLHEQFYGKFNVLLRSILDERKDQIPTWFTANFITYARTWVVFPTLLLMAWGYTWWAALLVILVDFGDFLDGVVARFWVDVRKEQQEEDKSKKTTTTPAKPVDGEDDDSDKKKKEDVVEILPSLARQHRDATYGGFIDAVCDKAYIVPCWISLTHVAVSMMEWHLGAVAIMTLCALILAETASACIRFRAFFTSAGVSAPPTAPGFDFSTSAVKADSVGKAKQTFEMVGTALFILNWTRWIGLASLLLALPLAYESVRRKIKKRVFYVPYNHNTPFSHATMKFWMQAKALGASQLIVGVVGGGTDNKEAAVANARSCSAVDHVLVLPTTTTTTMDETFLDKYQIDYVFLSSASDFTITSKELLTSQRVLVLGADGMVRPFNKDDDALKKDE